MTEGRGSHVGKVRTYAGESQVAQGIVRRCAQIAIGFLIEAGVLFLAAGTLNWPVARGLLAEQVGAIVVSAFVLLPTSPELIVQRGKPSTGVQEWDHVLAPSVSVVGPATVLIVAGLNRPSGWPLVVESLVAGYGGFATMVVSPERLLALSEGVAAAVV